MQICAVFKMRTFFAFSAWLFDIGKEPAVTFKNCSFGGEQPVRFQRYISLLTCPLTLDTLLV